MKNGTKRLTMHEVSGGFATVQPDSQLSINAVEGFPLEDFSAEAVRNQIQEAQKVAGGSGSEQDIAEAKIELEVRSCTEYPVHTVLNTLCQVAFETKSTLLTRQSRSLRACRPR